MNHKLFCCAVLAMGMILPPANTICAEPAELLAKPEPSLIDSEGRAAQTDRRAEAAIEAAVAKPVQLDFAETPLKEVIEILKAKHQIEIQMDRKAMEDAGVSPDAPVTNHVRGVTLRSALNLMLRELGLVWIVDNEVLLITTPEVEEARLITKVYDVADLVACCDSEGNPCDDYQMLTDAIRNTIRPTTWDTVGGAANVSEGSLGIARVLIISQTGRVHREIAALLADIRAVAAKKSGRADLPRRNPTPPEPVAASFADQVATPAAERAKAALLEMLEANRASLKDDFSPKKMETLRQTPPEKEDSENVSQYRWGPFRVDLKSGTYNASVGNMIAMRIYSGKFSVGKDGKWTAEKPSVSFLDSLPSAR